MIKKFIVIKNFYSLNKLTLLIYKKSDVKFIVKKKENNVHIKKDKISMSELLELLCHWKKFSCFCLLLLIFKKIYVKFDLKVFVYIRIEYMLKKNQDKQTFNK